jgi:hypothetical protein
MKIAKFLSKVALLCGIFTTLSVNSAIVTDKSTYNTGETASLTVTGQRYPSAINAVNINGVSTPVIGNNLLKASNNFSDSSWTKSRASVSATTLDVTLDSGEVVTMSKVIEDGTASATHRATQVGLVTRADIPVTARVLIKQADAIRNGIQLVLYGDAYASFITAVYNAENGTITTSSASGAGTVSSATITPLGNGVYECILSGTVSVTANSLLLEYEIRVSDNSNLSTYSGDSASGVYVAQAQLVEGTESPKYSETSSQLIISGDDASTASWNASSIQARTPGQTDHQGGTRATKITAAAASAEHYVHQDFTLANFPDNRTVTVEVVAKAAGYDWIRLGIQTKVPNYPGKFFNLANGTIGSNVGAGPLTSSITPITGAPGWYRCRASFSVSTPGAAAQIRAFFYVQNADASIIFTGDAVSGILIADPLFYQGSANERYSNIALPRITGDGNRLVHSGDITNASWTKQFMTAPGTTTTATLTTGEVITLQAALETTTSGYHEIKQSTGYPARSSITQSVIVKSLGRDYIGFYAINNGNGADYIIGRYRFSTNTVDQQSNGGTGSGSTLTAEQIGDGAVKLTIKGTVSTNTGDATFSVRSMDDAGSSSAYVGDITKGFYMAEPIFVAGSVTPSYSRTYGDRFVAGGSTRDEAVLTMPLTSAFQDNAAHQGTRFNQNITIAKTISGVTHTSSNIKILPTLIANFGVLGSPPYKYAPGAAASGDDMYIEVSSGGGTITPSTADFIPNQISAVKFHLFDVSVGEWIAPRLETFFGPESNIGVIWCNTAESIAFQPEWCYPKLTIGTPSSVTPTTATVPITTDRGTSGVIYALPSTSCSSAPSEATVLAGQQFPVNGTSRNTAITGLTANTTNCVWYVQEWNKRYSEVTKSASFTTPPVVSTSSTFYVKQGGSDSANGLSDANAWASPEKCSNLPAGSDCLLKAASVFTDKTIVVNWNGLTTDRVVIGCYYVQSGTTYNDCDSGPSAGLQTLPKMEGTLKACVAAYEISPAVGCNYAQGTEVPLNPDRGLIHIAGDYVSVMDIETNGSHGKGVTGNGADLGDNKLRSPIVDNVKVYNSAFGGIYLEGNVLNAVVARNDLDKNTWCAVMNDNGDAPITTPNAVCLVGEQPCIGIFDSPNSYSTITNNTVKRGHCPAISIGSSSHVHISDNRAGNASLGIRVDNAGSNIIERNLLWGNPATANVWGAGSEHAISLQLGSANASSTASTGNNIVRNNIVLGGDYCIGINNLSNNAAALGKTQSAEIYGNTCMGQEQEALLIQHGSTAASSVGISKISNNIFYSPTGNNIADGDGSCRMQTLGGSILSHNLWNSTPSNPSCRGNNDVVGNPNLPITAAQAALVDHTSPYLNVISLRLPTTTSVAKAAGLDLSTQENTLLGDPLWNAIKPFVLSATHNTCVGNWYTKNLLTDADCKNHTAPPDIGAVARNGGGDPPVGNNPRIDVVGNYFFDDALGSDTAGNGSATSPWKSAAKCASLTGDSSCYFRHGQIFPGPLTITRAGTPSKPITIGCYYIDPNNSNQVTDCIRGTLGGPMENYDEFAPNYGKLGTLTPPVINGSLTASCIANNTCSWAFPRPDCPGYTSGLITLKNNYIRVRGMAPHNSSCVGIAFSAVGATQGVPKDIVGLQITDNHIKNAGYQYAAGSAGVKGLVYKNNIGENYGLCLVKRELTGILATPTNQGRCATTVGWSGGFTLSDSLNSYSLVEDNFARFGYGEGFNPLRSSKVLYRGNRAGNSRAGSFNCDGCKDIIYESNVGWGPNNNITGTIGQIVGTNYTVGAAGQLGISIEFYNATPRNNENIVFRNNITFGALFGMNTLTEVDAVGTLGFRYLNNTIAASRSLSMNFTKKSTVTTPYSIVENNLFLDKDTLGNALVVAQTPPVRCEWDLDADYNVHTKDIPNITVANNCKGANDIFQTTDSQISALVEDPSFTYWGTRDSKNQFDITKLTPKVSSILRTSGNAAHISSTCITDLPSWANILQYATYPYPIVGREDLWTKCAALDFYGATRTAAGIGAIK